MAEPKTKYEYGSTPEQEQGGIWPLLSQLGGLFTPERREVITPSKTTYTDIDGVYFPNTTPGVYGPVERGIENMPVVQGAKSAYEFLGDLISSGKKRGETADALVKGIGTLIEDQKRAGINAAMTGQTSFYDPKKKREVAYDPLLTPATMGAAGLLAPVKGPGAVLGMFAGRNAATADLDALKVAQKMETKGNSRDEILDQTGWFRYQDREGKPMGEWKFEIPDDASVAVTDTAALKPYLTETGRVKKGSGQTGHGPEIDKLLVHDKLNKAYPGTTLEPVVDSLKDITLQRAALKAELVALKKRGLGKEELDAETKRLEALDGDLIRKLIDSIPTSAVPGGPAKTVREQYPLLDRPIGDTVVVRTTPGGDMEDALGYYKPDLNVMALLRKQDSYPITNQPSLSSEYLDSYFKARDAFKDVGLSLSGDVFDGKVKYSVRKRYFSGPLGEADPKNLPDNLKKQLDQLQDDTPKQLRDMSLEGFRSTALHELQHAIQRREGFETGGMSKEFGKGFKNRPVNPTTGKQLTPWETYAALVGETEARLVQKRMDMTPAERRIVPPYSQVDESMMYTRKDLGVDRGDSFSLNNAPTSKMPELKIDNPGGKWLEGKLQQAADDRRLGKSGFSGAANITGSFKEPLNLPPGLLKDIPGNLGEEALRNTGSKLVALKKSISEEGYKPSPILIHVREDGKPFVVEGNHRIVEALQSGRDTIPVELRYLRGGEGADGLLSPNRLKDFFLPEVKKASGGFVDKPLYDNSRLRGV